MFLGSEKEGKFDSKGQNVIHISLLVEMRK